ncbi:sugar ABC transporter permease [Gordoniibacillus kamchatkensis]|uniref:Sugar ABC transporter permease n=1 Tax=Gordoniibacillus kamchatkensis TaxID=1590651 RepID=A0ABR5ANE9_9BACL|nr:sugar ABC transporter permease [Paenibacillus sp. VKM B-2647]KIL42501.1 sugar ABC transporter permease [Paenibacillus sp. VKM B-2647]
MERTHNASEENNSLQRQERRAGHWMMVPALAVIAIITIFPIIYSVWMSLNNVSLTTNGFTMSFAGMKNYGILLKSAVFWQAVWFTFYFSIVTVAIELVLGVLISLSINGIKRLKNISMIVMLIPWALITVISAQMWSYIYNGVYGLLNYILQISQIIPAPITWLGSSSSAVIALMIADIWKTTPFVVIISLAGLQMIPVELYESAYIDGANRWQMFWRVTLPLISGSVALAGLFRILQAFGLFDLPFVLTQGGPGTSTQSLAILSQKVMFQNLSFGPGSAVAVTTVLIVLVISLAFFSVFKKMVSGDRK